MLNLSPIVKEIQQAKYILSAVFPVPLAYQYAGNVSSYKIMVIKSRKLYVHYK
jgi:hypothetical protein